MLSVANSICNWRGLFPETSVPVSHSPEFWMDWRLIPNMKSRSSLGKNSLLFARASNDVYLDGLLQVRSPAHFPWQTEGAEKRKSFRRFRRIFETIFSLERRKDANKSHADTSVQGRSFKPFRESRNDLLKNLSTAEKAFSCVQVPAIFHVFRKLSSGNKLRFNDIQV